MNEHDAIARIKRLSHSINCADEIAEVIERLIKERDEARQEVCSLKSLDRCCVISPKGYAELRKWDCFSKEDGK